MIRKICLLGGILMFLLPLVNKAADIDSTKYILDTLVSYNGHHFQVRRLEGRDFTLLYKAHAATQRPSRAIKDIRQVEKNLGPGYHLAYRFTPDSICLLKEVRYGNRLRVLISETDGFQAYYPRERILVYYGGHSRDEAFYVHTGERAYNPEYSAVSPDRQFRCLGLHSGQEHVNYTFDVFDKERKVYLTVCGLLDITGQLSQDDTGYTFLIFDSFWVGNTFYFRTGWEEMAEEDYRYIAISFLW